MSGSISVARDRAPGRWLRNEGRRTLGLAPGLACTMLLSLPAVAGAPALSPPAPEVIGEARILVQAMREGDRGPYSGIRWFCKDGTVHPAKPYPCGERGGGVQHAAYSTERERLAALGWHVGTVVTALTWDELWQPGDRLQRLRELPLERYLEDVDDGWVLHRAQYYRGRVQLEDEEKAGREWLLKLLAQPGWSQAQLLLAREVARVIPHGRPMGDRTREVRHLSQELADRAPSFARLRIEVHSRPDARTAGRVRDWLAREPDPAPEERDMAGRLATGLDALFGIAGRQLRLQAATEALATYSPEAAGLVRESLGLPPDQRINRLARAMGRLRADLSPDQPGASLRRLDLLQDLEAELRTSALEYLEIDTLSRQELLGLARALLEATWGLGLLSAGERDALAGPLAGLSSAAQAAPAEYALATRRLALAAAWAALTVRYTFAEPLARYTALDPRTGRFVDDLLRESVLLPLGELAHRLALDGAHAAGIGHRLFGAPASGLLGINPGVARGRLRILSAEDLAGGARPGVDEVVVLTETVADLTPVAGILTLGEGNPLSHVQMLARNLGIPNAVVAPELLPVLRQHQDGPVLLAVAGDGRVLLQEPPPGSPAAQPASATELRKVSAPRPDLSVTRPLPLAELNAGLSGRVVGPKAANVGELNRLFPGRIVPAVALPFGIFAAHTEGPRQRLAEAFRRHRAGELDQPGLEAELAEVRTAVAQSSLSPELVSALLPLMDEAFGPERQGVFVRSDTNVEDLPEFTGAGLNETVPNVVGRERQLAAVPRVWSSVYTSRAMAWRGRILKDPEAVFASVLLMQSVPAEKSGVLVTKDLATGGQGLTVSVAWGVGGAVDNESAASQVLRPDGSTLLLAEAKAPYRRTLRDEGGVGWSPAAAGPVLTAPEQQALRELAAEVEERYPRAVGDDGRPLPWDIEFGFAGGQLWLLQIRPLVQRGQVQADAAVNAVVPRARPAGSVDLGVPPNSDL